MVMFQSAAKKWSLVFVFILIGWGESHDIVPRVFKLYYIVYVVDTCITGYIFESINIVYRYIYIA